jgi:predicted GIY-YIG superfamily endonuclease
MTRTVYLLHFSKPLSHAQHYIGVTKRNEVDARILEHSNGEGAKITRAANRAGITFTLARVWPDAPFAFERQLKQRGSAKRICPICKGNPP